MTPTELNSVRTEFDSHAKMRAYFSDLPRRAQLARPQISFVLIVRTASQFEVACDSLPAISKRHDMMEFQKPGFRAATLCTAKGAPSSIPHPHLSFNRRRNVPCMRLPC